MRNSPAPQTVRKLVLALLGAVPFTGAMATNGYFSEGYGIKAKGMGGASVAMAQDGFAGANNPASASFSGNRTELGLTLFNPNRDMARTGGSLPATAKSDGDIFLIPEFGYTRIISDKLAWGLTVYGNGGMNTNYPGGQINCGGSNNVLCGSGSLGVDLIQLIVAPTLSYKLNEQHAIGISPLLVHQQFKAYGLDAFSGQSSNSSALTGKGYNSSSGLGVRLGYMGRLSDAVSIGASYSPRVHMGKLSNYAGLFAGGGSFDIPANYALGVSFQATPTVTFAVDYQKIKYSGVPAIANPSNSAGQLGAADGKGFGWSDVNVWKLGVQWQATDKWTLRAGYNKGDNPIQARDVTFNILAPGVVTSHYTLGATYALSKDKELSLSFMHAPRQTVSGTSTNFGGTETIGMSQNALGVQFGWKF